MVGGARVKGTAGAGGARPGRRSAGELEAEVLGALWTAGRPLAPAEVHAELGPELAYSTVTTILHRLYRKGVVTRHPSGRGNAYLPAQDEATHRAQAMHALLRQGSDHAAVLARFVTGLSPDDERVLHQLLRDAER
jgi:predicted transcriptional regulator